MCSLALVCCNGKNEEAPKEYQPNESIVVINAALKNIPQDTLMIIDRATDHFCECLDYHADSSGYKYMSESYINCFKKMFNEINMGNEYQTIMHCYLYFKRPQALFYYVTLWFTKDEMIAANISFDDLIEMARFKKMAIIELRIKFGLEYQSYFDDL
jgi:hypothetical protein